MIFRQIYAENSSLLVVFIKNRLQFIKNSQTQAQKILKFKTHISHSPVRRSSLSRYQNA